MHLRSTGVRIAAPRPWTTFSALDGGEAIGLMKSRIKPEMASTLTDIERKILDYMVFYLRSNTYQPSIREIGEEFGIKSTKTVSEHLQALDDKGFLERDPSRSRGVRILGVDLNAQTVSVPCYGELPEDRHGFRSDAAEMYLSIDRRLAGGKGSFFVRARGDRLAAVGVNDGDFVLIEPALTEELLDGAVVVARLTGSPDFYRFEKNGEGVCLHPMRADEVPTAIEDASKLGLVGRVSALYRRMDTLPSSVTITTH